MSKVNEMWEKAISLYEQQNVVITIPSPEWAEVTGVKNFFTPLGIAKTDVQIFDDFASKINPKSIFVIGNAFGWSVTLLSLLFCDAKIDVIDAEIEHDGKKATEIAKKVFSTLENNKINLYIGFSPQDVPNACKNHPYDVIFIDGEHSEEQVKKDFNAVFNLLSEKCVIFFHDVELLKSTYKRGVEEIFDFLQKQEFTLYSLEKNKNNQSGMWVATRGF